MINFNDLYLEPLSIDGYAKLRNGLIQQTKFFEKKKEYTPDYVDKRYNSYGELSVRMSYLRLGFLLGALDKPVRKILDVGYGNGDFLNVAKDYLPECCGFEVNGYSVPEGCEFIHDIYEEEFDVACFFDVLEHFDNIYDIKKLDAKYIYISVPECHFISEDWFEHWKHRRPDEHLWHFRKDSLEAFMGEIGYSLLAYSNVEDAIRKPEDHLSNILSGVFKRT